MGMKKFVTKATGSNAARLAAAQKAKEEAAKKAAAVKLQNLQPHQLKAKLIQQHPSLAKDIVNLHGARVHSILQLPKKQQLIALKQAIKNEKISSQLALSNKQQSGGFSLPTGGSWGSKQTTTKQVIDKAQLENEMSAGLTAIEKNQLNYLKMSGDTRGLQEFWLRKSRKKGSKGRR